MDSEQEMTKIKRQGSERQSVALTQDEVVLRQLSISDLLVQSAAGVQVHLRHEAVAVELLLHLQHLQQIVKASPACVKS